MNRMLAIYNGRNKKFRHDGDEFQREALGWSKAQPEPVELVDVRDGKIRAEIRKMTDGLDVLAIFDHGTPKGLPRMRESYRNVKGLAETIAGVTDRITVVLYACSCGRGWWWWKPKNKKYKRCAPREYNPRDGYAMALACELLKIGVTVEVWAHLTTGHTTRNPHVVWAGHAVPYNIITRQRPLSPGTPEWKQWKIDMRGPKRFTFWK